MNSKLLRNILIFFIILLVITITTINIINKKQKEKLPGSEKGYDFIEEYGSGINGQIDYQAYFDVKQCMQKYLNSQNPDNAGNTIFVPLEISMIQSNEIKSFLTYGLIQDSENYTVLDKKFAIVNLDISKGLFSIELIDGDYNSINEITVEKMEDTITASEGNEWIMAYVETEDILKEYINTYKWLAFGAPERLYELLDEEYRNTKFGSLEKFKKYIENNKNEIKLASLSEYQISFIEEKTRQIICIDRTGRYYIIKEKAVLQDYTLMLDTYTVDLPEFIEKYDNSEEHKKVALNIQKLVTATKNKDYEYVYNKLDDTFKASNFPTLEDFKKYIKEKYDSDDRITFDLYKKAANIHLYDIKAINTGTNKNISARVAMDLKNNRDFKFSFSVNN